MRLHRREQQVEEVTVAERIEHRGKGHQIEMSVFHAAEHRSAIRHRRPVMIDHGDVELRLAVGQVLIRRVEILGGDELRVALGPAGFGENDCHRWMICGAPIWSSDEPIG